MSIWKLECLLPSLQRYPIKHISNKMPKIFLIFHSLFCMYGKLWLYFQILILHAWHIIHIDEIIFSPYGFIKVFIIWASHYAVKVIFFFWFLPQVLVLMMPLIFLLCEISILYYPLLFSKRFHNYLHFWPNLFFFFFLRGRAILLSIDFLFNPWVIRNV